jgi:hypothetical protein
MAPVYLDSSLLDSIKQTHTPVRFYYQAFLNPPSLTLRDRISFVSQLHLSPTVTQDAERRQAFSDAILEWCNENQARAKKDLH